MALALGEIESNNYSYTKWRLALTMQSLYAIQGYHKP